MRIGVLGGTFDPPHRGHLEVARAAIEALDLDEVLFMPASRNPLRRESARASSKQRLKMVELIVEDDPNLAVSDLEIGKGGKSYAVDTMAELAAVRPAEYWFLLGADALHTLPKWKQPLRLVKLCRIGAVARELQLVETAVAGFPEEVLARIDRIPMQAVMESSSALRERLFKSPPLRKAIPPKVLQYIEKENLYRS